MPVNYLKTILLISPFVLLSCKKDIEGKVIGVSRLTYLTGFSEDVFFTDRLSENFISFCFNNTSGFYYTDDQGDTFNYVAGPNSDTLNELVIVNESRYFARFHTTIYETVNGGDSWTSCGDYLKIGKDENGTIYAFKHIAGYSIIYDYHEGTGSFYNHHIIADHEYGYSDGYELESVKFTGNYCVFQSTNNDGLVYHNAWDLKDNTLRDFNDSYYYDVVAQNDELYYSFIDAISHDGYIIYYNPNYTLKNFAFLDEIMIVMTDSVTVTNYYNRHYSDQEDWEPLYLENLQLIDKSFEHAVMITDSTAILVEDDGEFYFLNL